jgi:two-component system response regulator HydG
MEPILQFVGTFERLAADGSIREGGAVEQARLLIGDDDPTVREAYTEILGSLGHLVDQAADGEELLQRVRSRSYDMVFTDLRFPPTDGISVLKEVKRIRPSTLVVIFTGHATVSLVLQGFRNGAFEFLEKPVDLERFRELASRALEIRKMGEKRRRMAEELENERLNVMRLRERLDLEDPFQQLVGSSGVMRALTDTIREVARTDSTVLLTGESGTGKGLVARTLHEASTRRSGSFVEANCVVYSEGVLHSELFGHERGAFTGADRSKKGRFELAQGGTLFLDEIGEISASTQLLLLRVLQDRNYERVGGEETLETDVRLIAATNRDLQAAIEQGSFRSDLFYRLNVIPVHLPALRDRPDDIPVLAQHFLARCATRLERPVEGFSPEAVDVLSRYAWPGNIRELENLVERVVVMNRTRRVEARDLPPTIRQMADDADGDRGTLQEMERKKIIEALEETLGNKKLAARRLGIHRSTLYAKMRRFGLAESADAGDGRHRA